MLSSLLRLGRTQSISCYWESRRKCIYCNTKWFACPAMICWNVLLKNFYVAVFWHLEKKKGKMTFGSIETVISFYLKSWPPHRLIPAKKKKKNSYTGIIKEFGEHSLPLHCGWHYQNITSTRSDFWYRESLQSIWKTCVFWLLWVNEFILEDIGNMILINSDERLWETYNVK